VTYEPGQVLFNKGDAAGHLAIITEGSVEVFDPTDNRVLATLGAGASFGEMAILEGGVRGASIRAASSVKCIEIRTEPLRAILKADTGLLVPTMEGLLLQQSMANFISRQIGKSEGSLAYEILGDENLNSVQLQRKLNEAYANPNSHGLGAEQLMYLKLQATDRLQTSLYRAGRSLGSPSQPPDGEAFVLVEGAVEARVAGGKSIRLRHGSVLGLAEGITGSPFSWSLVALEDVTVKIIPMDRVLRDLERANTGISGIVRYTTSRILELQKSFGA
jgi:CRP-like cAMP-binding protein